MKKRTLVAGDHALTVISLFLTETLIRHERVFTLPSSLLFLVFIALNSKMIGVFRRSSLPSRHTISAALRSYDSGLSQHFTSAATGASAKLDPIGNGSNLSSASSRISFQGYATERATSVADSKSVAKIKITPENAKPLTKKVPFPYRPISKSCS